MASSRVVNSPFAHTLTPRGDFISTDFDDPEEESIRLAIALQLLDLENAQPDEEAAVFEVYRSYLEESEQFLADRRLAEELAVSGEPSLIELMEDVLEEVGRVNRKPGTKKVEEIDGDDDDDDGDDDEDPDMRIACALSLKMFEEEKRWKEVCSPTSAVSVLPAPT